MNSSSFFKTESGACYLYDVNHKELVNVHPVIEAIHNLANDANIKDKTKYLKDKFPELTQFDIQLYQKKYDFLKTHDFFSMYDFDQVFCCRINAKQVENQMVHFERKQRSK